MRRVVLDAHAKVDDHESKATLAQKHRLDEQHERERQQRRETLHSKTVEEKRRLEAVHAKVDDHASRRAAS